MEAIKLEILKFTANELKLKETQVKSTIGLFDDGATVPFIARYRKEVTGNLDEELETDIRKRLPNVPYIFISSHTQYHLKELKDMLWNSLN